MKEQRQPKLTTGYELRCECFEGRHICFENAKEPGAETSEHGGKKAKMIIFYHFQKFLTKSVIHTKNFSKIDKRIKGFSIFIKISLRLLFSAA